MRLRWRRSCRRAAKRLQISARTFGSPPDVARPLLPRTGLARTSALEPAARGRRGTRAAGAGIANDAMGHEPVPDEQDDQRADGCADKPRALIESVPADGLSDECCD